MYSQFIKELIDLPDVLIQKVRKEGERWIFELSLPEQCPLCPVCLKRTIKMTDKKKQWMHGYAQRIGIFWLYTICWGLETIQKIIHVGSDFFYTGFGQPTKKGATCQLNRNIFLPGLKDVKINKVEICEHSIHLYVEMPVKPHRCPRCGTEGRKIHDYRIQKIRHLKWFERPTVIFYRKRRYACQTCGKRFAEENPFVERYQRFSKEWNQAVNVRSIHAKTFKDLAFQFGASVSTVIRRFDAVAKKELQGHPELPKVIAIDEYKGDTRAGKYQVIIADGQTGEPVDILPNRKKKTISRYLKKYGAQVETVIMDMSHSFKLAVREALDRPLIIADRFHDCRYVYWALDQVRRNEQAAWSDYDRKKCKRMRRIFYKKKEELNAKERWYLNRYLQKSETLKKAYELKEAFCRWLELAKENGAEGILQTKEELHQFYQRVEESGIEAFQRCVRTLRNWEMEILNSFIFGYTNGFLEGINNHTKVMKRNAYGFRNFERARARILLTYKYKRIGVHVG